MTSAKAKHPNKTPFEGVLTRLDIPSDSPPSGARDHRVILTRQAAEDALDGLVGMAVSFQSTWDGHNQRQKCGVITRAWIEGDELRVEGHLYSHDFPEVLRAMAAPDARLGMSYEMVECHVEDLSAAIYRLTRVTFTGAAILLAAKAAYRSTRINLAASGADIAEGRLALVGEVKLLPHPRGRLGRWLDRRLRGR